MIKKGNTPESKSRSGRGIRKRGNNYEVLIAKQFRELGWEKSCTARAESRNADSQKRDIMFVQPFRIQCKCRNNFSSPVNDLKEMPQDEEYNLIFQKVVGVGEYIVMGKSDFYELIIMLKKEKII